MSGDYWFFLSYASDDAKDDPFHCVSTFHDDLAREVRRHAGLTESRIGYFDRAEIELGDEWPDDLTEGLRSCRVFVPLYSRTYFVKEYCGREWAAFRSRLDAHAARSSRTTGRPPLVMPVLLQPVDQLRSLPPAAVDVQYMHDDFPEAYAKLGIVRMMKLSRYRDDYLQFVMGFADKLVKAAEDHPLSELPTPLSIKSIASAFHLSPPFARPADRPGEFSGPRYVQFVFVAGRPDELSALRRRLDYYGQEGGREWNPYVPELEEATGILAQSIAAREKLHFDVVPLDESTIQELKMAKLRNNVVVIVVDSWTLRLEHYRTIMQQYDEHNLINCAVLVPWNPKDEESNNQREALEYAVQRAFPSRIVSKDPTCFLDTISTPDEYKASLEIALSTARAKILRVAEVFRRIEGGPFGTKPEVVGPGGA